MKPKSMQILVGVLVLAVAVAVVVVLTRDLWTGGTKPQAPPAELTAEAPAPQPTASPLRGSTKLSGV